MSYIWHLGGTCTKHPESYYRTYTELLYYPLTVRLQNILKHRTTRIQDTSSFIITDHLVTFAPSMSGKPSVKELVCKADGEIICFLEGIYEHSPWVAEELVNKSDANGLASFETVSQLAGAMKAIVDDATRERKLELLRAHPDLCEKVGKIVELTAASQEEQSRAGLQSLSENELERFSNANSGYRAKFGFPFILAVRNATKFTVLAALEGRLSNCIENEFVNAISQVHKIAWMRLLAAISTDDANGFLTSHVLDTANGCPGTQHSTAGSDKPCLQ